MFQGAGALLPQVATKLISIGLPLTELVLASYQPGNAPLPVVFGSNANPYNGVELAILANSPVRTIADLQGRAIGVGALTWGIIPQRHSVRGTWRSRAAARNARMAAHDSAPARALPAAVPPYASSMPETGCARERTVVGT